MPQTTAVPTFLEGLLATLRDLCTTYLFKLIIAALILFIGTRLVKVLMKVLNKSHAYRKLDDAVRSFLGSFIKIALYVILFITAATELGVPATSFVTALASCGLAIGLALQGSLANLAGGLMILIFKPFKLGDYIVTGAHEGTVKEINVLYTVLTTPDNRTVTIPNATVSNAPIVDVTGNDTRRLDVGIGVSYGADVARARTLLTEIASACAYVLKDPAPQAVITEYADSSVNLSLRVWVKTADYWTAKFEINENIKKIFDQNGIEIPFPQMDVHIKQN